jgi:hypothetical protein
MPTVPHNLALSDDQLEVLAEKDIAPSSIYIIKRETLHPSAVRVDGYTNGHYVFFLEGTATEHAMFLQYLYGKSYEIVMPTRFRGITIYGSPTERYVTPANLVNVQAAPISPINYTS